MKRFTQIQVTTVTKRLHPEEVVEVKHISINYDLGMLLKFSVPFESNGYTVRSLWFMSEQRPVALLEEEFQRLVSLGLIDESPETGDVVADPNNDLPFD